jgi:hypothetical protein
MYEVTIPSYHDIDCTICFIRSWCSWCSYSMNAIVMKSDGVPMLLEIISLYILVIILSSHTVCKKVIGQFSVHHPVNLKEFPATPVLHWNNELRECLLHGLKQYLQYYRQYVQ